MNEAGPPLTSLPSLAGFSWGSWNETWSLDRPVWQVNRRTMEYGWAPLGVLGGPDLNCLQPAVTATA